MSELKQHKTGSSLLQCWEAEDSLTHGGKVGVNQFISFSQQQGPTAPCWAYWGKTHPVIRDSGDL